MATNFETQFTSSADLQIMDGFGETISYTSYGNAAANITAKWTPGGISQREYSDGMQYVAEGLVECKLGDITTISDRDLFTIDGATWSVERVIRSTPMVLYAVISRDERYIGGANTRTEY